MLNSFLCKSVGIACIISFLAVPIASAKPHDQDRHRHRPSKPTITKPVIVKPKPIVVKPRPIVIKPRPIVVKPRPIVVKPRPIVVKPKKPKHQRYHRRALPKRAVLAVISGISYAIIDNMYYQKQGKEYVYDPRPPKRH